MGRRTPARRGDCLAMLIKTEKPGVIDGTEDIAALPPFEPPPWLRGGHAQTIAGRYWPMPRPGLASHGP